MDVFLENEISDLDLSQACDYLEDEYVTLSGMTQMNIKDETEEDAEAEIDEATGTIRFGNFSEENLEELLVSHEKKNTKANTKWAFNIFTKWRDEKLKGGNDVPELLNMTADEMNVFLQHFIAEIRNQRGEEYSHKTVYYAVCGILRYLKDNNVHDKQFLDTADLRFVKFRAVLDAKMKDLVSKGVGTDTKQADPILPDQEETLWLKGVFGGHSSEALQHTVFYYACKVFGLRGHDEHRQMEPSQFKVGQDAKGKYIQFIGRNNKTFDGGLNHLNFTTKNIRHYCPEGKYYLI